MIAISGGSGSGKTTLAHEVAAAIGHGRAQILAQDSYYIDQSRRFDGDGGSVNFDHPSSIDFPLMAQHLDLLKDGLPIEVPIYDFGTHTRRPETEPFSHSALTLVEGTLLLSQPLIRARLDFSIFVETPEKVRFERRLRRDTHERGRTPEGVTRQFQMQVKPMHDEFVEPSKAFAHLIVSGEASLAEIVALVLTKMRT